MQIRKKAEVSRAMDKTGELPPWSQEELLNLFGTVKTHSSGRPIVTSEEDDKLDWLFGRFATEYRKVDTAKADQGANCEA